MTVTWDTSAGTAPWTVTVAPLGHVPISVSLPSNYMSTKSWQWQWNVPGYPTGVSQVIVAVSDSTGKVSGTSAFSKITKAGSCSAPPEHLDFIWYPPSSGPKQCDDWLITVQEDHGNLGLKLPVDLLILPENDVPTTLRLANGKHTAVDWTVNYPQGTKFAIASFDAGASGTGGVGGDAYTVGHGRSAGCIGTNQQEAVAGLPAATSTAAPVAVSTSAAAPSRMATSRVVNTPTSTHGGGSAKATASSTGAVRADATESKSSPSGGVIGGAIGGVLGALAITGLAVYFYRKHETTEDLTSTESTETTRSVPSLAASAPVDLPIELVSAAPLAMVTLTLVPRQISKVVSHPSSQVVLHRGDGLLDPAGFRIIKT